MQIFTTNCCPRGPLLGSCSSYTPQRLFCSSLNFLHWPGSSCKAMAFLLARPAKPTTILSLRRKYVELQLPVNIKSICNSSEALLQNTLRGQLSHTAEPFVVTTKASQTTLLGGERAATLAASCRLHSLGGKIVTGGNALQLRVRRERSIAAADGGKTMTANSVSEPEELEDLSRAQLLWRAAKLPIYSVAIVPLSVGGAAAFWQTGVFNAARYWLMFWSSILVITWLNLSNDAYDWETGVDQGKRESVVNITGSQKGVLWAALACLLLGFTGLVFGASRASDMRVAVLLAAAIGCGYVYQCPPFRLSYKGLGEPLCFLAFGPLATIAFYLSQAQPSATVGLPVTLSILGASVLVGITTALILFCSHFHQIEGDTLAGKFSPLVRMGTENGSKVVKAAVTGLYLLVSILTAVEVVPPTCAMFSLMTLPIGKLVLDFVKDNHSNKELIFMAKYYAVRLHLAFGIALILGFSLASRLNMGAIW